MLPLLDLPPAADIDLSAAPILQALTQEGACLAVAQNMEKAVVVRDTPDGQTQKSAICARDLVDSMAQQGWIEARAKGQITRFHLTAKGRSLSLQLQTPPADDPLNMKDAPKFRDSVLETPIQILARRKDKTGTPFLRPELVQAAERLREDFELSEIEHPHYDWPDYIAAVQNEGFDPNGIGPEAACARVCEALNDLGEGLGHIAYRSCCLLEGMERVERDLGWSARSGKIVLRIALERLHRHYKAAGYTMLIG